ncbi:MAG: reverse transcriptase domain-containing protein [Pseudomonadota bacterium]
MKTYKHLYSEITDFENLRIAFKRAARGKRKKSDVAAFEFDLEANLVALQTDLMNKTYTPGPYINFRICDSKPRLISAAPFRDRVVHHALCQVIEPIWERRFIHDTYACRIGKGTHAALDRATEFSRRYPYVLKCDIEHFFPAMDHAVLYRQLARLIADPAVLSLCKKIIDSGARIHAGEYKPTIFPGDDLFDFLRPRGLPIGNLTSQFWANVYLNPLDQFIKQELGCRAYLRYVDDTLHFADDKETLHRWRKRIIDFLAGLRLTLHANEAVVFPVKTGIPFLGWRVYPSHRRLKRRNGVAFQRRFALMRREIMNGGLTHAQMKDAIQSWVAHVAHGDTWRLRRSLLSRHLLPPYAGIENEGRLGGCRGKA